MYSNNNDTFVKGLARISVGVAAFITASVLVITQSSAAFSDTTANSSNSFSSGTVVVTDDDTGSSLFNATSMVNGSPVVNCIQVSYTGDLVPADIKLYATSSGVLDDYLDTTIEVGTGATFGSCGGFTPSSTIYSGTLDNLSTSHTGWANGIAVFTAASNPTSVSLRFTVEVQDNASAQGQSASAEFTFEAQNQ